MDWLSKLSKPIRENRWGRAKGASVSNYPWIGWGNVKRISFGRGLYGTPVWSPRGDLIAFTKLHKGKFYIGVMRTDGSGERLLTENFYQEAPSWSPNGRVLIFYRETKTDEKGEGFSAKLWSIDLTGYNERLVNTPADASDPSWSSLLSN